LIHHLELTESNTQGAFSREFAPVLTIAPGDSVRYRTLDASWGLEPPHLDWSLRREFPHEGKGNSHALSGPVAILGAHPGMTLGVYVERIVPGAYGYTFAGGWPHPVNDRLGLIGQSRGAHLYPAQ